MSLNLPKVLYSVTAFFQISRINQDIVKVDDYTYVQQVCKQLIYESLEC